MHSGAHLVTYIDSVSLTVMTALINALSSLASSQALDWATGLAAGREPGTHWLHMCAKALSSAA